MISIRNVSHRYGREQVLHDVSLDLPKYGVTAIIGPNGAGKSTLLALISRIIALQEGCISIDDLDVAKTPSRELARKMALAPQDARIESRLSVGDLVGFGRWPRNRGRQTPEDLEIVEAALEAFGLTPLRERMVDELSGGQRQRAFVAMAYAQGSDWMLLDEPLNHLDMAHARALMVRLHALSRPDAPQSESQSKSQSKSIVMVLHEVNYAAAWADWVVAMKDGRVALQGPPAEVFSEQAFEDIYGVSARVHQSPQGLYIAHHR